MLDAITREKTVAANAIFSIAETDHSLAVQAAAPAGRTEFAVQEGIELLVPFRWLTGEPVHEIFVRPLNEVRRHGNVTRPFRRFFAEQINKLFDIPFGNGQTGKKSIYFAVLLRGADGPCWSLLVIVDEKLEVLRRQQFFE